MRVKNLMSLAMMAAMALGISLTTACQKAQKPAPAKQPAAEQPAAPAEQPAAEQPAPAKGE